jgi:multimeric flavodoxin WrbA
MLQAIYRKKQILMAHIIIINGRAKKNGNTAALVKWFTQGARSKSALVEIVRVAELKLKLNGCISWGACQKTTEYRCAVQDDATLVLTKMAAVDVIVMATSLYFISPSAQIKPVFDRMFSLYK